MACDYLASCPFPNDKMATMPVTTSFMAQNYCHWDFTKCVIYRTVVDTGIHPDGESSDEIFNLLICGRVSR